MAWVQVGSRKINTATLCYMEQQEDEKLKLHFQGQDILELDPDESRALWKHLKSEDALAVKDKGSSMVLPKRWSGAPGDAIPASATPAKPLQIAVGQTSSTPAPAAAVATAPAPSQPKPQGSSHSHGQSHSSSRPHSSSHSSSSHRPSSSSSGHQSSSSSHHRSSSHSSSSHASASKPTEAGRVLEFKKD